MSIDCPYFRKSLRLEFSQQEGQTVVKTRPCCHMHGAKIPSGEYKNWMPVNTWEDLERHPNRDYFINYQQTNTEFHPACSPCEEVERVNPERSPRIYQQKEVEPGDDYFLLDVVVGSTCNLACPFCSAEVSSLIAQVAAKHQDEALPVKWRDTPKVNAEPASVGNLIADFIENRKVKRLKIIGGEPLLKENWDPLSNLIESGACQEMDFALTTNGTIVNDRLISNLHKVKSAILTVSADSIGKNYDFIRWPYSWEKAKKNIDYLIDNAPESTHINVDGVVSIINFELLPEADVEFSNWYSHSFNFDLKPSGSALSHLVLPESILKYVYDNIKRKYMRRSIEWALDNYKEENLQHLRDQTRAQLKFLLRQRGMSSDVFGPLTQEYLDL